MTYQAQISRCLFDFLSSLDMRRTLSKRIHLFCSFVRLFVCLFYSLFIFAFFYQGEHQAAVDIYDEEVNRTFEFELYHDFSFLICSSFP